MRRSRLLLLPLVVLALSLTSCRDRSSPTRPGTEPSYGKYEPEPEPDAARIEALITALYPKPGLEKAALNIWSNIQYKLAQGLTDDAWAQARAFASHLADAYSQGQLEAPDDPLLPPTVEGAVSELLTRLYVFVGLKPSEVLESYPDMMPRDFGAGDIIPGEAGIVKTSNGWAAVIVGADATDPDGDTLHITMELLDEATCAIADPLIQAMGCWDINRYPAGVFEEEVTVEICVADTDPSMSQDDWDAILVHHEDANGVVSALPWVDPGTDLDCTGFPDGVSPQTAGLGPLGSLFASVRSHVAELLMPEPLAARMPFFGARPPKAAGGATDTFSKFFGAVPVFQKAVPATALDNLVSWWPGDSTFYDISGDNHGTPQGNVFFGYPAISNQAFQFNGSNAAVLIEPLSDAVRNLQNLTLATWVYLDEAGDPNTIQRFVTLGDGKAVLRQEGGMDRNRMLHFYMMFDNAEGGTDLHHIRVDNAFQTDCYHFFAGTYDGTFMRAYLDGVEMGQAVPNGAVSQASSWAKLGASGGPGVPGEVLQGALDEVMIFDRALDPDEIQAIYDYPAGGVAKCAPPVTYALSGTVQYSATVVPGVRVTLILSGDAGSALETFTDAYGYYEFPHVLPGSYSVRVYGEGVEDPEAPGSYPFVSWFGVPRDVVDGNVEQNMELPKVIELSEPTNGSTVGPDGLSLSWAANAEASAGGVYTINIYPSTPSGTPESGQSSTNSYPVQSSLLPGETYTWQVAGYDADGRLVGATDQAFTYTLVGDLPDLRVSELTYAPGLPTTSDVITVTATVENIGDGYAPASTLYISPPGDGASISVPALPSGGTAILTRDITGFDIAQAYQVNATADSGDAIPETDEENNSNSVVFVVWTLRDATGDPSTNESILQGTVPDLETASVRTRRSYTNPPADSLFFLVRFLAGAKGDSTVVQFLIDTDQNPGTGFPGVDEDNHDAGLIGVDYIVEMGAEFFNANNEVRVLRWSGSTWDETVFLGDDVGASYTDVSMLATIPLLALGGDDGILNLKVVARHQIGGNRSFTGVLDVMSDVGLPVGVVYH